MIKLLVIIVMVWLLMEKIKFDVVDLLISLSRCFLFGLNMVLK